MNKLIIIHVDGLSYEYINNQAMPFLSDLRKNKGVYRLAPSLFFQANMPAYTGQDASQHGRIVEYIYDPGHSPLAGFRRWAGILERVDRLLPESLSSLFRYGLGWGYSHLKQTPPIKLHFIPFHLSPYFKFSFNESYLGEDIFMRVRKAGLRTAWDDEDFSSNVKRRWLGTYFYKFYPEIMVNWAREKIRKGIDFIWVDLGAEPDKYGHCFGPDINKFSGILKKIDRQIEKLITLARQNNYRFIVFSDHGMEEVKGCLNLASIFKKNGLRIEKDYIPFYDSTLARFWIKEKEAGMKIKSLLQRLGKGICIDENNCQALGIPLDNSIGEILFAVEQGLLILPNFYQGKKPVKGMHGYREQKSGPLDGVLASDSVSLKVDIRYRVKDICSLAIESLDIE